MRPPFLARQAALAAVAVVAGAAVAFAADDEGAPAAASTVAGGRWQTAVAAVYPADAYGRRTACDVDLTAETLGVSHPVLPCGVDLVLEHEGRQVRVEVVDRGPFAPGHEFDLTRALAARLGFPAEAELRWRFAG